MSDEVSDPHAGQPVRTVGEPLEQASAAVVMLHGRGASAEDILGMARELAFRIHISRAAGGGIYLVSAQLLGATRAKRAVSVLRTRGGGSDRSQGRASRNPFRTHRDPRFLAGCVPDTGICCPQRAAIRRGDCFHWRTDWSGRNAAGLPRLVRWHAESSSAEATLIRTFR